jgi:hypothetical protein
MERTWCTMAKLPTRRATALTAKISESQKSEENVLSGKSIACKSRIMYIERKAGSLTGTARIGRVTFNRSGRTIFYGHLVFHRILRGGFKSNYYKETSGEDYWISGCKRRGGDRLYASELPILIDEDVREEYWRDIRGLPDRTHEKFA